MATGGDDKTQGNILLAVDGSKYADYAAKWYVKNVHKPENTVILIFIAEPEEHPSKSLFGGVSRPKVEEYEKVMAHLKEREAAVQKKYLELLDHLGVTNVRFICKQGHPGEALVKAAKEEHCMLIVIGTRGLGTIRRTIMGSVSSYVMHHAHIPVAVACKD